MRPDGDVLTRQFGGASIQTSALTGEEVSATFSAMLRRIVEIGA
jgi:hypothetical protein